MFVSALFTISKMWEQPKCPLVDEGIKKTCYTYNGIQFSITKGAPPAMSDNTINLEDVTLNEASRAQKGKYPVI